VGDNAKKKGQRQKKKEKIADYYQFYYLSLRIREKKHLHLLYLKKGGGANPAPQTDRKARNQILLRLPYYMEEKSRMRCTRVEVVFFQPGEEEQTRG